MLEKIIQIKISNGKIIETFAHILAAEPNSIFAKLAEKQNFIDCRQRDERLIRILIDSLRKYFIEGNEINKEFIVPENFDDWQKLIFEAQYWQLYKLEKIITNASNKVNTITLVYQGSLAIGKQGYDLNFRRIHRILVCGNASSCRKVFGKTLNETRHKNIDNIRYTNRFYLTHTILEQAFDTLASNGYELKANTTNNLNNITNINKTHLSNEENKFLHYSQYVFIKNN